jgi:hypothetical protein
MVVDLCYVVFSLRGAPDENPKIRQGNHFVLFLCFSPAAQNKRITVDTTSYFRLAPREAKEIRHDTNQPPYSTVTLQALQYLSRILNVVFTWSFILFLATCSINCMNGGRCVSPDVCTCPVGYTGTYCQTGNILMQEEIIALHFKLWIQYNIQILVFSISIQIVKTIRNRFEL